MNSYKPDFFELLTEKNNLLKSNKKKINQNKSINLKLLGGYTNSDVIEWIKFFLLKKNINSIISESAWGPAYQNLNTIKKNDQHDFLLIINSYHDLLNEFNWFNFKLNSSLIKKFYNNFFINLNKKTKFLFLSFDKPKIKIKTNKGILNDEIDKLNFELQKIIFSKYKNGTFFSINNRNYDEYNNINLRDWYSFGKVFGLQQSVNFSKLVVDKIIDKIQPSKKIVILDLDNTLWGGVVGDSNLKDLKIGDETPEGRVFRDIQAYMKMLKENGIMLAIVSKNEEKIALDFLKNKKNILKIGDFVTYRINWEKKYKNIQSIQKELNIGLDSFVFIDDNQIERYEVSKFLPEVSVPNLNNSPEDYLNIINSYNFFSFQKKISLEDKKRTDLYLTEKKRDKNKKLFLDYDAFLKSLKINLNFLKLDNKNIERVHQLTNKTNQFNFTTKRMDISEIKKFNTKNNRIFVISAEDTFGDYGIISVVYVKLSNNYEIVNWLMSCRVFNKTIENNIMQEIIKDALRNKKEKIKIQYKKTQKNLILSNVLKSLGFSKKDKHGTYLIDLNKKINFKKGFCEIKYEK